MTTITPKLSSSVQRREKFLLEQYRKNLYNPNQLTRVQRLITAMRKRYGYTETVTKPSTGLTWANITDNGKYSLD